MCRGVVKAKKKPGERETQKVKEFFFFGRVREGENLCSVLRARLRLCERREGGEESEMGFHLIKVRGGLLAVPVYERGRVPAFRTGVTRLFNAGEGRGGRGSIYVPTCRPERQCCQRKTYFAKTVKWSGATLCFLLFFSWPNVAGTDIFKPQSTVQHKMPKNLALKTGRHLKKREGQTHI